MANNEQLRTLASMEHKTHTAWMEVLDVAEDIQVLDILDREAKCVHEALEEAGRLSLAALIQAAMMRLSMDLYRRSISE